MMVTISLTCKNDSAPSFNKKTHGNVSRYFEEMVFHFHEFSLLYYAATSFTFMKQNK